MRASALIPNCKILFVKTLLNLTSKSNEQDTKKKNTRILRGDPCIQGRDLTPSNSSLCKQWQITTSRINLDHSTLY